MLGQDSLAFSLCQHLAYSIVLQMANRPDSLADFRAALIQSINCFSLIDPSSACPGISLQVFSRRYPCCICAIPDSDNSLLVLLALFFRSRREFQYVHTRLCISRKNAVQCYGPRRMAIKKSQPLPFEPGKAVHVNSVVIIFRFFL